MFMRKMILSFTVVFLLSLNAHAVMTDTGVNKCAFWPGIGHE